jgi:hypothetical protein
MENSGMSKAARVKKERRSEVTDDNEDIIIIEELNKVLKHAKIGNVAN